MKDKNQSSDKTFFFILITVFLIFFFYSHTLFYGIKAFDELTVFKETYLPICFSIREVIELISTLGLNQHFESNNTLYSNISSLRCNPLGNLLQLLIQLFFQKNAFNYHLYSLALHLINTTIIFLILNKTSLLFLKDRNNKSRLLLISLLTVLWALHPVNIESILLITNANIILGYTFSLFTFYLFLRFTINQGQTKRISLINKGFLFVVFLPALLIAEFNFMLPFILLAYITVTQSYFKGDSLIKSFKKSSVLISSILLATMLYVILFLLSYTKSNFQNNFSAVLILERILWLSPQVIFHFIQLLLFPIKLSIDQTLLVKLGNSLFDPYTIFCIGFIFTVLILSVISLINTNKKFPLFFTTFFLLLLSLIPYSQIAAPVYNLASERYLYFPSFILIFGISHWVFFILSKYTNNKKSIFSILFITFIILVLYSSRAYIRTLDWQDNITLYGSAANVTSNPLFKAYRLRSLVSNEKLFSQYPEKEVAPQFQKSAIQNFKKAIPFYKKETRQLESSLPRIVKAYGLDPKTFLAKSAYLLAQYTFTLTNNPRSALNIMEPYTKELSILDSGALAFYASLLYYNNSPEQALSVLKTGYKINPYSTRIIVLLCDLIYIKYGDLKTIEEYCLKAFKYFPYDSYTIYALANTYKLMNNHEKYAYFSYIYGIRNHSIEALKTAYNEYLFLNNKAKAEETIKKILYIEKELQKRK